MKNLQMVYFASLVTSLLSLAGLAAIAIWSYFAAGDCALWVTTKIQMKESLEVLGSEYVPDCTGILPTLWNLLVRLMVIALAVTGVSMMIKRSV